MYKNLYVSADSNEKKIWPPKQGITENNYWKGSDIHIDELEAS